MFLFILSVLQTTRKIIRLLLCSVDFSFIFWQCNIISIYNLHTYSVKFIYIKKHNWTKTPTITSKTPRITLSAGIPSKILQRHTPSFLFLILETCSAKFILFIAKNMVPDFFVIGIYRLTPVTSVLKASRVRFNTDNFFYYRLRKLYLLSSMCDEFVMNSW